MSHFFQYYRFIFYILISNENFAGIGADEFFLPKKVMDNTMKEECPQGVFSGEGEYITHHTCL